MRMTPDAGAATGASRAVAQASLRIVFGRVAERCDLPALPAVAARASALMRDPEVTADDLARLVASDPAIAVRVLRISRSALYLRRRPPRTLREAILAVGFETLGRILIVAAARGAYAPDDAVAIRLWEHALATALAADELAVLAGEPRGGDAFVGGLLHDIGRLVLHLADPSGATGEENEAEERERFGVTHADVGGCLAAHWGLDPELVRAIALHHQPDAEGLPARVALAERLLRDPSPDALMPVVGRVGARLALERNLFA